MHIGVPRETLRHDYRVGLTPSVAGLLTQRGHTVLVEHDAGLEAQFLDRDYQRAGAQIAWSREEVYKRSELICRVGKLAAEDIDLLAPGVTVAGFHHLAVAGREAIERLAKLETTLIGYEVIRDPAGSLPVLLPMSEIAGKMAVHLAAYYLQNFPGGRGILLANVPGVPPPTVLVLGAGTVGRTAARQALELGAHVILVDSEMAKLRAASEALGQGLVTSLANLDRLERYTAFADVVIGAVLVPGSRAPFLVSEAMVEAMKPGSVIIDVAIDQGGCVETSRPTTHEQPTFVAHGVVHYCVPNMTANVARTASRALASAVLPCIRELADQGLETALRQHPGLAAGVYLYRGNVVSSEVAGALGLPAASLPELLGTSGE